nr:hypothetical protein [Raphanus sativus cryptic virus 3]
MENGANNPPAAGAIVAAVQPAIPPGLDASKLNRATEYLYDADKIRPHRARSPKYRRYMQIKKNEIYVQLIDIYRASFSVTWPDFRHLIHAFPPPANHEPQTYYACCYISGWFRDLYYHIRKALKSLSGLAELEYYRDAIPQMSFEYDNFLALLGAAIRPTHIVGNPEDVMYVPLISEATDVNHVNPFGINNYVHQPELFSAIVATMKDRKKFNMVPLPSNYSGRPSWLFDWHAEDQICAPFQPEGNFNNEDIAMAFVLGTACTSLIGMRDRDDWQFYPNANVPAHFNPHTAQRITPRTMYGSYEVRSYETDHDYYIPSNSAGVTAFLSGPSTSRKRSRTTSSSTPGSLVICKYICLYPYRLHYPLFILTSHYLIS